MSANVTIPPVASVADLYAIAHQIEMDAVERYTTLAEQMQTHNNAELVRMFADLARAERLHADEIRRLAGTADVTWARAPIGPWKTESPEAVDLGSAHYRMSPHDALQMALAGEQRALAFYAALADSVTDPNVRDLAEAFAEEEREHVELCHRLLKRYPPPATDRDDDPDAPQAAD